MIRRYLFGPVPTAFAEQCLFGERASGACITFAVTGPADVVIGPGDSWDAVCARLPQAWRPDLVVLYLPYTRIPEWLWSAPVPIVGLAADWNLLYSNYRHCLRR